MNVIVQNDSMGFHRGEKAWKDFRFMIRRLVIAFASVSLLFYTSARAQDSGEVVRVDTELAAFEVTVADKDGNPVRNLKASDFQIFEDGIERPVDFFQPIKKHDSKRPLLIVFALDVSGSMTAQELAVLKSAMQDFAARLAEYDSYFALMTFAMEVDTLQTFTNQLDKLKKSFENLKRDQDGLSTHAYDAVDGAVRLVAKKAPKTIRNQFPKKAVIVITDGFPVGDIVGPDTVIERANAVETSVYSIILPSFSRLDRAKRPLMTPLEASGLIEKTGGKTLHASKSNFEALFNSLAEEITASYAVAFYPKDEAGNGNFREVRIVSKSGLTIKQNRRGYTLK